MNNNSEPVPVMLYDGDCGFCQHWVEKWEKRSAGRVRYEPYRSALADYPQLTEAQCREAIHLVTPEGRVYRGALAVLQMYVHSGRGRGLLWCYEHVLFFSGISEWFYRLVSRNRPFLSRFFHAQQCRL